NLALHRAWRRRAGDRPFALGGECRRCARCCEAPAVRVAWPVWHLAALRGQRTFVFRCTHFDPESRACDSYDSRPGMCRDYPRALLWTSSPELFAECGYRAVAPNAAGLIR